MLVALPALSPDTIESFFALAFGFRGRGTMRQRLPAVQQAFPEFPLARSGPGAGAFCGDPAPDVLRALHHPAQHASAAAASKAAATEIVMVATVIAGMWSLMSGTVVVLALQALLHV